MKKIKIIATFLIVASIAWIIYYTNANAEGAGGTGTIIGGGGGAIGGTSSTYHDCGIKNSIKELNGYAYKIELVYKPRNADRYTIASAVVLVKSNSQNFTDSVYRYVKSNKVTIHNVITSGPLYELAKKIKDGKTAESLTNSGWLDVNLPAENWKHYLNVSDDVLRNEHEQGPGFNSFGYRLMVQQLTSWCQNGHITGAYPRKEMAMDKGVTANGDGDYMGKGRPSNHQGDIQTQQSDIGVHAATGQYNANTRANFGNKYSGKGYYIFWFPNKFSNEDYDYTIDTVCENCDSKDTNGSLIIKDTSNFKSILNGKNITNKTLASNVENYFNKGNGIYCREGYKIILPNANDQITVASGRYFTINKQGGKTYDVGVPNYKTIKVTKTRECRATLTKSELQSGMSASAQQNAQAVKLNNFKNNNKISKPNGNDYTGKAGTISLTYKETMKNSKYNTTVELEENKARTIPKDSRSSSNETYQVNGVSGTFTSYYVDKYTSEQYYELSNEAAKAVYRYVHRGTNTAVKGTPTDIKFYLDMETSNFPVSYNNNGDSKGIAATMKFNYKLPTNDKNSKMYTAFDANGKYNNKLTDKESDADNSYKKYLSGDRSAEVMNEINNSACAEKYGIGTGAFTTCAKGKTSGKTGDCYYKFNGTGYYTCDIKSGKCKDGEAPCPDGSCPVNGKCPNTSERSCKLYLGIYYGPNGEVIEPQTEEEFNKRCPNNKICRIENGKYYGQNGTEVTQEQYYSECPYRRCTIINGKYYGKNGQLVTQEIYQKECPYDCPFDCKYGCCPTWYEGSGMMCKDMNGECPLGGNRIIYRPIDLFNPFPGQTNYGRATGANWCSWNTKTGKITCNNGNPIVTREILNNRKTDNDKVYDKKPLYTFELDASSIQKIRNYNKKQRRNGEDYDDFTLNCTNPNKCFSTFFRDKGIIKMDTNNSACARTSELDKCAESEEGGR